MRGRGKTKGPSVNLVCGCACLCDDCVLCVEKKLAMRVVVGDNRAGGNE